MTGGERALDLALREQWPRLVLVAHSQEQVGEAVVAHLPAGMRASASDALRRAWEAPTAPVARGGLETLVASWQQEHPGAASRLAAEVEATTVPQALGVHGAVALRLRSTAPASYLLERCWVAARRVGAAPHGGREWVAAIAAEALGRQGERNGTAPGYVVVGGRKAAVRRPRLVDASGHDLPLESYAAAQDPTTLARIALGKVLEGIAQRQVRQGLERDQPLPAELGAYGASKSSVSRRWIAATVEALEAELQSSLAGRRLLAILLDGKGFGDYLLVTALGIDEQGRKHILGVWEGDGENTEVCVAALQQFMDRGLDVGRGVLVVLDGGKGLASAVRQLWGDVAVVARCRVHYADVGIMPMMRRNVLSTKTPRGRSAA